MCICLRHCFTGAPRDHPVTRRPDVLQGESRSVAGHRSHFLLRRAAGEESWNWCRGISKFKALTRSAAEINNLSPWAALIFWFLCYTPAPCPPVCLRAFQQAHRGASYKVQPAFAHLFMQLTEMQKESSNLCWHTCSHIDWALMLFS